LLDFLSERFPAMSRSIWQDRMACGDVLDDNGAAIVGNPAYQPHQRIYYYRAVPHEPTIPFEEVMVFEDEHLIVVDKPHFLPVVPSGGYLTQTLLVRLKNKLQLDNLVPIHRIDRDTAGLVMFSKQPASRGAYCGLFSQHAVRKTYQAIAPWRAELVFPMVRQSRIKEAGHFMLQHEIAGPVNAITHIEVLEVRGNQARYQLKPVTGQRHQLRVHMNALGLPLCHDGLYPTLTPEGHMDYAKPLQLLAKQLEFTDPITGQHHQFQSTRTLNGWSSS
jgi:tRNA pseudouridine32 synthase/23S rRNA pseudouridine746 synthase